MWTSCVCVCVCVREREREKKREREKETRPCTWGPLFWQILSHQGTYKSFYEDYLFIFRERGREGEREGAKHQCVVASHAPATRDLACNPDMCPDWELNRRPSGSQAGAQSTEPHQPGLGCLWFFTSDTSVLILILRVHLLKLGVQGCFFIWD